MQIRPHPPPRVVAPPVGGTERPWDAAVRGASPRLTHSDLCPFAFVGRPVVPGRVHPSELLHSLEGAVFVVGSLGESDPSRRWGVGGDFFGQSPLAKGHPHPRDWWEEHTGVGVVDGGFVCPTSICCFFCACDLSYGRRDLVHDQFYVAVSACLFGNRQRCLRYLTCPLASGGDSFEHVWVFGPRYSFFLQWFPACRRADLDHPRPFDPGVFSP